MVTTNFDKLSEEHKSLQTIFIIEKEKASKRCSNCEFNLENINKLKKHDKNQRSTIGKLICDICKKEFNEEWKLSAHQKIHKRYQCDQYEKSF